MMTYKQPPSPSTPIKLTYWAAKGIYQKSIGHTAEFEGEGYDSKMVRTIPKKFYFGADLAAAQVAATRVSQLWDELEAAGPAHWTEFYLRVAKAIIRGEHIFEVAPDALDNAHPGEYAEQIAQLNKRHRSIRFLPADPALYAGGQEVVTKQLQTTINDVRERSAALQLPDPTTAGQTVHAAVDAFAAHIRSTLLTRSTTSPKGTSEWGHRLGDNVTRLKDSLKNVPLHQFGYDAIAAGAAYWKARPYRKGTEKPISIETVLMQLKAFRRFIDWLDATDSFKWDAPKRWQKATSFRRQEVISEEEQSAKARGVRAASYTIEELTTLYKYATQWERLLLLLGLNFAFAQAEIQSLKMDEINLKTLRVERVRRKKGVYGKFLIWPETALLLQWAIDRRAKMKKSSDGADITLTADSYVILTDDGQPVYRMTGSGNRSDSVANAWNRLTARIQLDQPEFRRLSFKHLRKTAGDLIRRLSDGEIAGVFQSRANVVSTDDEADEYTTRPYEKVFQAQKLAHELLAPMFAARPEGALDVVIKKSGPNVTRKVINDIKDLASKGVSPTEIANLLKVTRTTVYRYLDDSRDKETESV